MLVHTLFPSSFSGFRVPLSPRIYSIFWLADLPSSSPRFWFHDTNANPSSLGFGNHTVLPSYHDSHNLPSCRPSCTGSITGPKLVDSVSSLCQQRRRNSHMQRLSDRCPVVLFHRSLEPLDNLLVIGPLHPWRRLKFSKGENSLRASP